MITSSGHVFWICGLSGAGKSTAAAITADFLRNRDVPVLELDGDVLRKGLCRGLGFSANDRSENLRRAAEVAAVGATSGLCVLATFITPLESHRALVRDIVGGDRYSLVFADAPLAICMQRDPKGLYTKARAGKVSQMTGVSSLFERPALPDLLLPTAQIPPEHSGHVLSQFVIDRLRLVTPGLDFRDVQTAKQ